MTREKLQINCIGFGLAINAFCILLLVFINPDHVDEHKIQCMKRVQSQTTECELKNEEICRLVPKDFKFEKTLKLEEIDKNSSFEENFIKKCKYIPRIIPENSNLSFWFNLKDEYVNIPGVRRHKFSEYGDDSFYFLGEHAYRPDKLIEILDDNMTCYWDHTWDRPPTLKREICTTIYERNLVSVMMSVCFVIFINFFFLFSI